MEKTNEMKKIVRMIPEGLSRRKMYSLTELTEAGYTIARLQINRAISPVTVNKKIKSIKKCDGTLFPLLAVPAEACLAEGLEVMTLSGEEITMETEGLDKILTCVEGNHRLEGILLLNSHLKPRERPYECYFFFPIESSASVTMMLLESNVASKPWSGGDYLTSLLINRSDSDIDLSKLKWSRKLNAECSETCSWLWSNLENTRVPSKSRIIAAEKSDEILKSIADTKNFEYGKRLYEALKGKFYVDAKDSGKEILGIKVTPLFFIEEFQSFISSGKSEPEATDLLLDFIDAISEADIEEIRGYKSDKRGLKRERKVENKFRAMYRDFALNMSNK
ncbi:MAG: hypothetical protein SNI45_05595 [Rikenellaceae bacterium]